MCKVVFEKYDKNGDGHIQKNELKSMLTELDKEISDNDIQELVKYK